jgi:hypothetical protein
MDMAELQKLMVGRRDGDVNARSSTVPLPHPGQYFLEPAQILPKNVFLSLQIVSLRCLPRDRCKGVGAKRTLVEAAALIAGHRSAFPAPLRPPTDLFGE